MSDVLEALARMPDVQRLEQGWTGNKVSGSQRTLAHPSTRYRRQQPNVQIRPAQLSLLPPLTNFPLLN